MGLKTFLADSLKIPCLWPARPVNWTLWTRPCRRIFVHQHCGYLWAETATLHFQGLMMVAVVVADQKVVAAVADQKVVAAVADQKVAAVVDQKVAAVVGQKVVAAVVGA